ncbi:MAG: hypothetical protein MJE66_12190 [Proteobacteria bacterium]|nr:hypothetical protein [Pseudomonadota bacterium]
MRANAIGRPSPWLVGLVAGSLGCALWGPRVDPAGEPKTAIPLRLGTAEKNQLDCRRGDCVDWYRLYVPTRGQLRVQVTTAATKPDRVVPFRVALGDERAQVLQETASDEGSLLIHWPVSERPYFLRVRSDANTSLHYAVVAVAVVETAGRPRTVSSPPPPRRLETLLIELEDGPGEEQYVLIGSGADAGVKQGDRGRLTEGPVTLAEIEIVEVYPDGARARLTSPLRGTLTPASGVEIDLPTGR